MKYEVELIPAKTIPPQVYLYVPGTTHSITVSIDQAQELRDKLGVAIQEANRDK